MIKVLKIQEWLAEREANEFIKNLKATLQKKYPSGVGSNWLGGSDWLGESDADIMVKKRIYSV